MPVSVKLASTEADIRRCHKVMVELRPHLDDADAFVAQTKRQAEHGYQLAYVEDNGRIVACAGFRCTESLAWSRFLYVDDLVTAEAARSRGHGKALLDWLGEHARAQGCQDLQLDSGTWRQDAHRFYFREGMTINSFHFGRRLG